MNAAWREQLDFALGAAIDAGKLDVAAGQKLLARWDEMLDRAETAEAEAESLREALIVQERQWLAAVRVPQEPPAGDKEKQ